MGINLGSTEISDIKLGDTQVEKICLGSTEMWSSGGTTLTDYGRLFYYPFSSEYAVQGGTTRCTVNSIDQTTFASFATAHPGSSWTFQYTVSSGVWKCSSVSIAPEDMLTTTGVDVTITASGTARFVIRFSQNIDTSATPLEVTLANSTEYAALNTSSGDPTIGGLQIPKAAIQGYEFGSVPTTTPDYFLASCSNLASLTGLESSSLTTIGGYFLAYSVANLTLTFPGTVTSIGDNFLYQCSRYNSALTLPSSLTTIGDLFMAACSTFNQSIDFSHITTIGNNFMQGCSVFNQALNLVHATTIGDGFLSGCSAYNQPLTVYVTTIGNNFLYQCLQYNSALTLINTLTIGNYFMGNCESFNSTLTLPNTLTTIGQWFMRLCAAFNKALAIPASVTTIGSQFMYRTRAFNQLFTIPATVTFIGHGFFCELNTANTNPKIICEAPATVAEQDDTTDTLYGYTFGTTATYSLINPLTLAGTYAADWKAKFPDRDSTTPYRKTVIV